MITPLVQSEIEVALHELKNWSYIDDRLTREIDFPCYATAISFIVRISYEAEALNHHPKIINDGTFVSLVLTSHDTSDKVTSRDIVLAEKIETLLQTYYM
ncbi:MAG: 4a-hydroxytetrahydrobiopterin dehydratase [Opitutales bacterium]|nr:4a-hydroxytetrahydrobiopterin dehydratase [Opitutales bacterium]